MFCEPNPCQDPMICSRSAHASAAGATTPHKHKPNSVLRNPQAQFSALPCCTTRSQTYRAAKPMNDPPPLHACPLNRSTPPSPWLCPEEGLHPLACTHHAARYAPCPHAHIYPACPCLSREFFCRPPAPAALLLPPAVYQRPPALPPTCPNNLIFPTLPIISTPFSLQTIGCILVPHPCSHAPASHAAADALLVAGGPLLPVC